MTEAEAARRYRVVFVKRGERAGKEVNLYGIAEMGKCTLAARQMPWREVLEARRTLAKKPHGDAAGA